MLRPYRGSRNQRTPYVIDEWHQREPRGQIEILNAESHPYAPVLRRFRP